MIYPSNGADRFQVRLPDGLRDRIKADAAANNRSMNSEIVARLEVAGVPLRDWFAGRAMHALLSDPNEQPERDGDAGIDEFYAQTASAAYEIADAMLAAREARS